MKKDELKFRQGDVGLIPVPQLPAGAKKVGRDKGRIVLAYGEVTGHAHAIAEDTATLFQAGEDRFLAVRRRSKLKHEEHATVVLEPGVYKVRHQREYSPEEIRRVAD